MKTKLRGVEYIVNMTNALILDKNKHALLIHNIKNKQDRFEFPGGKVEENESLEKSVIREVEEELGIKIKIIKRDKKKKFGDYATASKEGMFLCRTYHAEIVSGEPKIMEKDKADYWNYFNYNQLLNLYEGGTLAPNIILALPKLKEYVK